MSDRGGPRYDGQLVRIPKFVLEDRILGAWVGKSYGAAMGEPLEFAFNGRIFLGAVDVQEHALREWLVNEDDLYMNMANLAVVADKGLGASSDDFAIPYREGKFLVWHANGQARQNVLAGIPAELSGHPAYNPHADDIDFQIECDYIGMISPGLPEAAQGPVPAPGAGGELRRRHLRRHVLHRHVRRRLVRERPRAASSSWAGRRSRRTAGTAS